VKELEVFLNRKQGEELHVGTLVERERRFYFQYAREFIETGLQLSPYHLPLKPGLIEHRPGSFGQLFGLFDDSLPDGWGLLLMDRILRTKGINPRSMTPLDRLTYMGNRSMGALSYRPAHDLTGKTPESVSLSELSREALHVFEGEEKQVISQLVLLGGSPQGARPKILVLERPDGTLSSRIHDPRPQDKHWLIKFDVGKEFKNFSKVEYLYSILAKNAGLAMQATKLFKDQDGQEYFGVERFDRDGLDRIHMHTLGGLVHSDFRVPGLDYQDLLKVTQDLCKDHQQVMRAFRQMVFNILAANRDDHVKNFSFILRDKHWELSPCYDLTPSTGPGAEHSLSVMGKGKDIAWSDIDKLIKAQGLNLKHCRLIVEEVQEAVSGLETEAKKIGLESKDIKLLLKSYSPRLA
jgi:serine/threonine-protein kinase HipA